MTTPSQGGGHDAPQHSPRSASHCKTRIYGYVTTLPHRGRVGPPPSKEAVTTFNTSRVKNEPTQPTDHYALEYFSY